MVSLATDGLHRARDRALALALDTIRAAITDLTTGTPEGVRTARERLERDLDHIEDVAERRATTHEAQAKGGRARFEQAGREGMSRMGRMGGRPPTGGASS